MKKNVPAKESIIKQLRSHRLAIRNFGVRRLGLFGSFVRNSQRFSSDVDLLIEFEKGKKNFDNFIQLNFYLEDVLKRRVEIVTTESMSPHIGPYVLKEVEYVPLSS
jgi:predicted nucleotidyltransferase